MLRFGYDVGYLITAKGMLRITMKSLNISCVLTIMTLLTGCQAIQFFDSPIPVTSNPKPVIISTVNS